MGELLIKEGSLFLSILTQKLALNEGRTAEIKKFAVSITKLLQGFTGQLSGACRSYFRKLKVDQHEDQNIIFLSKFIVDILNELTKKIQIINKKIELDVIEPLNVFSENQKLNHREAIKKSEDLLYHVQHNNDMLKELNQNYRTNELSSSKSKQQKKVLKDIVEYEIQKCNDKWQDIKKHYQETIGQLNSYNSLRCHFTMKTQIEIVKLINRLVNSTSVQESLEDYEDLYLENQTLSIEVKDQMREKLGRLVIFQQIDEADLTAMVNSQADEKEKRVIDNFVNLFTNRSNLKQQDQNYEYTRSLILEHSKWTNYFLNKLRTSLHTEIKLSNSKYRQLASLIKYIFALMVEAEDSEPVLYNLLYISYKVRCKDQYLIKELGKNDQFWNNESLWESIIEYIRLTKIKGKINHQARAQLLNGQAKLKEIFNKALMSAWIPRTVSDRKLKSQKLITDSKVYQILCEVNYYMVKLELDNEFMFNFILSQSVKYGLNKQNIRKLLEYHYLNKMSITNKQNATYLTRKHRLENQSGKITNFNEMLLVSVQKCFKYLPLGKELVNVLLVCKDWKHKLKKCLYRRYLIEENSFEMVNKLRLKVYKNICHPPFSQSVYHRMVGQVPQFTEHIQIIKLDARRSLGWDETLRSKMIEVLNAFAFYHPDNGYLQGMNYLCQNILKLTDNTYICYFIFEHLMNNQYYGMYTGNFDGLKLRIYQFMRMLEREIPDLFDHLRAEKIEGEHFLLSWTITLWGQMSGQLSWVLWDGFLVEGWIWWFKMVLWLMKVLQPELMKMNFQEIMKLFSDLHASLFSYSLQELGYYGIDKKKMKGEIDGIRIEPHVLEQVEKEYRLKANMINQYLKKSQKKK